MRQREGRSPLKGRHLLSKLLGITPVFRILSMPIDIAQWARNNVASIEQRHRQALANATHGERAILDQFTNWLKCRCWVTVNTKLFIVIDIVSGGKYLNMYERAEQDAGLFGTTKGASLRAALGAFYERRMTFTAAFKEGEKFCYGAPTSGGGGLRSYDPYCLQLKTEFLERLPILVYLPGDSLIVCFRSSGEFDPEPACQRMSPYSHRHIMAATSHADHALSTPKENWSSILNREPDYIEAIFIGDVTLANIERVQMLQSEYDRLISIVVSSTDKKASEAELTLMYFFRKLLKASRDNLIKLEIVS
jgi:hypothetical protein